MIDPTAYLTLKWAETLDWSKDTDVEIGSVLCEVDERGHDLVEWGEIITGVFLSVYLRRSNVKETVCNLGLPLRVACALVLSTSKGRVSSEKFGIFTANVVAHPFPFASTTLLVHEHGIIDYQTLSTGLR